jgi:hypothetical protein
VGGFTGAGQGWIVALSHRCLERASRALAAWTDGGWRFVATVPGMAVWLPGGDLNARLDGSNWQRGEVVGDVVKIGGVQVIGARQPSIAAPLGGAAIDAEARTTIASIAVALSAHGLIKA